MTNCVSILFTKMVILMNSQTIKTKLYLLRYGETIWNQANRTQDININGAYEKNNGSIFSRY